MLKDFMNSFLKVFTKYTSAYHKQVSASRNSYLSDEHMNLYLLVFGIFLILLCVLLIIIRARMDRNRNAGDYNTVFISPIAP